MNKIKLIGTSFLLLDPWCAYVAAAQQQAVAEPTDWMNKTTQPHWTLNHKPATFQW